MAILFAMFYVIPAALAGLVFWAIWGVLRLRVTGESTRRTLFVTLSVLLLTPVLIPAATIYVALVPHAVVLVYLDIAYYFYFAKYLFPSFLVTGLLSYLVARWRIVGDAASQSFSFKTILIPVSTGLIVLVVWNLFVPDRDISPVVGRTSIDQIYGESLDDVLTLLSIQDPSLLAAEIDRLKKFYESNAAVLDVSLQDPGQNGVMYGQLFYFNRGTSAPSRSCSGVNTGDQEGLMRCTWDYGVFDKRDVLRYERKYEYQGESLKLTIAFEYDELIEQLNK